MVANASDDHAVNRVEFRLDGRLVATEYIAPYDVTVNTKKVANGTHTLTATVYDNAGLKSSDSVSLVKGTTKARLARTASARATKALRACTSRVFHARAHSAKVRRKALRQARRFCVTRLEHKHSRAHTRHVALSRSHLLAIRLG
jgi:hypothetical protein